MQVIPLDLFKFHASSGLCDMHVRQAARSLAFFCVQISLLNKEKLVDQIPSFPLFQGTLGYRLMLPCFQNMVKQR